LIRSSYEPDPLPEIGRHDVQIALMPFQGTGNTADFSRVARSLNHPLRIIGTDRHEGRFPTTGSMISVSPENLVISTLKPGADESSLILRVYETAGKSVRAVVRLNPALVPVVRKAEMVDLTEHPVPGNVGIKGNTLSFPVPAYGLATIAIHPEKG
jgi:alpha-mannosidase